MVISVKSSKNKSSRLKADYFEVLIAVELARKFKVASSALEESLETIRKTLLKTSNGYGKREEQESRAFLALPIIVKTLMIAKVFKEQDLAEVMWVGRNWQKNKTLSDVNLIFQSGNYIGISLKSTRGGSGTQKNIGSRQLQYFLGLDLSDEVNQMWFFIKNDLKAKGGEFVKIAKWSKSLIKKNKYKFPSIQTIGAKNGKRVQEIATRRSVELFNKLNLEKKRDFLGFILGRNESKPLLSVLVSGKKVQCSWSNSHELLFSSKNIEAKENRNEDRKGYQIFINRKPVIRVQCSFTNGIGISAFCERAFII